MMFEWNPVPKPMSHQKEKDKPDYKERRYNRKRKKKKKVEMYNGVKIPHKKQRSAISKKDYEKALEHYGGGCAFTGRTDVEMHHVKFRSQGGKGGWRNLIPLTKELHYKAHTDREFADMLREMHENKFGQWYWCDKYDLFKEGLIDRPTDELFERFFETQNKIA